MRLDRLHDWNVTPKEAAALQRDLAPRVDVSRPMDASLVETVAGVDVSVKRRGDGPAGRAAVVVMRLGGRKSDDFEILETAVHEAPISFPYVPGLLAFREGPLLEAAFAQLKREPDAFIFDGQGYAHPRRMGIASHMGLWLERPTAGCGKTRLVGTHDEPGPEKGDAAPLTHRGEIIGTVLRTRAGVSPVFASPGHLCDAAGAANLILRATTRYRLPEPVRAAHKLAGAF